MNKKRCDMLHKYITVQSDVCDCVCGCVQQHYDVYGSFGRPSFCMMNINDDDDDDDDDGDDDNDDDNEDDNDDDDDDDDDDDHVEDDDRMGRREK